MALLQYPVQFELFHHGRLNPEVPLEEAGDCGANTLLLLGLIELDKASELSTKQNKCWLTKSGKEFTPRYVFGKYLFTDRSKQYEVIECNKKELMMEVQELMPGYGTFLYMENTDTHLGHYTCIYKNIDGYIEIADLQREEMIKHHVYDPDRLDDYLSQYDLFYIPSTVKQSKQENSESHGSPAKIPDIENLDANSPEKVKRPSASERTPLSPLQEPKRNRGGTRRKTKRRTRRKN